MLSIAQVSESGSANYEKIWAYILYKEKKRLRLCYVGDALIRAIQPQSIKTLSHLSLGAPSNKLSLVNGAAIVMVHTAKESAEKHCTFSYVFFFSCTSTLQSKTAPMLSRQDAWAPPP